METASMANRWVDSYLSALLGAGLSTEHFKAAAEQKEVAEDDADANIAAKYYVNQILNLDEDALAGAWQKVSHKSNIRMADDQDARLQYLSWRVWGMKRRHATVELQRATEPEADLEDSELSETRSEELTSPVLADADEVAKLVHSGPTPSLPRLTVQPPSVISPAAADADVYDSDDRDNLFSPVAPGSPSGTELVVHTTLTADRVPKLYCVLISMHGLVRGDAMELGKDPDTGGQVKYVVELAKALSRHPAVHRVDLLTRLIRDPKVSPSYGELEEALTEREGEMGGAYICRIKCGPVDTYLRKEQLWPYIREFADNALTHVCKTLTKLAAAGEACELYDIHGHYADAGEAAALMSYTLGVDMVLTGHSLGRNKLDHLLKSGTMSRAEIEAGYAISRRIEAEERALDAALLVFTSTQQEVKDQWGLYDGYNQDLERVVRARVRRGRHFPIMRVIPPGLDFSNLKISPPPDPLEALTGSAGGLKPVTSSSSLAAINNRQGRRRSSAGSNWAVALGLCRTSSHDSQHCELLHMQSSPTGSHSPPQSTELTPMSGATGGSPLAASSAGGAGSPRTPATPAGVDTFARPIMPEDPPIWRSIFKFLRNPRKPVILAMSRPDAKKNITTLVKAYGKHKALREIANLVLIMGNREVIDSMAPGSAKVLDQVLKLIDAYDLYGSVAYPKRHTQDDISDIYLLPAATRGVFVNIALQEPFGLTLIEAAAHGVPIVATTNGGPVDIVHTLSNGILVDPTKEDKVADALLELLTNGSTWDKYSASGVTNINAYSWSSHCMKCLSAVEVEKANFSKRDKNAQLRSNFSASLDDFSFNRISGSFSDHRAPSLDAHAALLSPRSTATLVGQSFTTDDINFGSSSSSGTDAGLNPSLTSGLTLKVNSSSGGSPSAAAEGVLSPKSGGGRAGERGLAASSVPLAGVYGGDTAGTPTSAFSGAAAAPPPDQLTMVRDKYMVFCLDSSDTIDRLGKLLARKGKVLMGLAKAGHSVGLAVASAFSLQDTIQLLQSKGMSMADLDFAVTSCGAEVWYCGEAAATSSSSSSGSKRMTDNCVLDDAYDLKLDLNWDALSVRRVLSQCMGQLLRQLPGVAGGNPTRASSARAANFSRRAPLSLALPRYKIQVQAAGASHHLVVTLDPHDGASSTAAAAPAGAEDRAAAADNSNQQQPALSPADVETLIMRIKRRLRKSGLRTQILAQMDAGSIKLHITPLRGSRALALRHLAYVHKVDMSSLVLVACAKDVQPGTSGPAGPAKFACSDMEDLVSGVQGVLVVPPPAAAAAGTVQDGFGVDLELFTHDARLQLLPGI